MNCLSKLALPQNATSEHRTLAVDLAEIIVVWETDRIQKDRLQKLKDKKKANEQSYAREKIRREVKIEQERKKSMQSA